MTPVETAKGDVGPSMTAFVARRPRGSEVPPWSEYLARARCTAHLGAREVEVGGLQALLELLSVQNAVAVLVRRVEDVCDEVAQFRRAQL